MACLDVSSCRGGWGISRRAKRAYLHGVRQRLALDRVGRGDLRRGLDVRHLGEGAAKNGKGARYGV